MPRSPDQVLTVAQMRGGEQALIDAGSSVDALMQVAGSGAAEWVWRVAAGRTVTLLCGPGNNGGDGYVIAEVLRGRGLEVCVIAATDAKTDAANNARTLYQGAVLGPEAKPHNEVLVDCLFGSGLTRALSGEHLALLTRLAASHPTRIAIDLPTGVESDSGAALNPGLPEYQLTLALGAWKAAHFLMPACAAMGALRLVEIGIAGVDGAARVASRPQISPPAIAAHKYRRGLLGVVGGDMPGAAVLACLGAQGAGAGYVKLLGGVGATSFDKLRMSGGRVRTQQTTSAQPELVEGHALPLPADLVLDTRPLSECLTDPRWNALLVGPGLGREGVSLERLVIALAAGVPAVVDADGLMLLTPRSLAAHQTPLIATPHEGELAALEHAFGCTSEGAKPERARALAEASNMVIVAKGPDTVIAAPDGRLAFTPRASSWLSTAGTGDVLAGAIASRLATGAEPFEAACQGVWLHGEAARLAGPAFTASQLAQAVRSAYAACL